MVNSMMDKSFMVEKRERKKTELKQFHFFVLILDVLSLLFWGPHFTGLEILFPDQSGYRFVDYMDLKISAFGFIIFLWCSSVFYLISVLIFMISFLCFLYV